MGCTMEQAANLAAVSQKDVPLDDKDFVKIGCLELLSPQDRKIFYRALCQLDKSRLSDWEKPLTRNVWDQKRLDDITEKVKQEPTAPDPGKPFILVRPFVWCAKRVYLWVLGTFFGRISATKLHNKVAAYRQAYEKASVKYKNIMKEYGTLDEQKTKVKNALEAQHSKVDEMRKTLSRQQSVVNNILGQLPVEQKYYDIPDEGCLSPTQIVDAVLKDIKVEDFPLLNQFAVDVKELGPNPETERVVTLCDEVFDIIEAKIVAYKKDTIAPASQQVKSLKDEQKGLEDDAELLKRKYCIAKDSE